MIRILLVGPKLGLSNPRVYGGGEGGYTRNMKVYLKHFNSNVLELIPCYLTVRGQFNYGFLNVVVRGILDVHSLIRSLITKNVDCVHVLAQYRKAVYREYILILLAKLFGKRITYEIKAGSFQSSFLCRGALYKGIVRRSIKSSDIILVEGHRDIEFLRLEFQRKAYYFPNVVPKSEIPNVSLLTVNPLQIKLLFVGYAYSGKGVYELLSSYEELKNQGFNLSLTFIGGMEEDFVKRLSTSEHLKSINILGKMTHNKVLSEMLSHDIYIYPSKHSGEGHNNSINEALMSGLIVCSTRNGFLDSFLNDLNSYEIKNVSIRSIKNALTEIISDVKTAKLKAEKGKCLILKEFNTEIASMVLHKIYKVECSN